jgi:hypothetical protein
MFMKKIFQVLEKKSLVKNLLKSKYAQLIDELILVMWLILKLLNKSSAFHGFLNLHKQSSCFHGFFNLHKQSSGFHGFLNLHKQSSGFHGFLNLHKQSSGFHGFLNLHKCGILYFYSIDSRLYWAMPLVRDYTFTCVYNTLSGYNTTSTFNLPMEKNG